MKEGFSKLNKSEKIDWVINNFFNSSKTDSELLKKYWSNDDELQKIHDEFSENTISNFLSTEIEWVPLNKIELLPVEKEEIINFLGILDDDDDVQNVYTNAKL